MDLLSIASSQMFGVCFLSDDGSIRSVYLTVGVCTVGGARVQAQRVSHAPGEIVGYLTSSDR